MCNWKTPPGRHLKWRIKWRCDVIWRTHGPKYRLSNDHSKCAIQMIILINTLCSRVKTVSVSLTLFRFDYKQDHVALWKPFLSADNSHKVNECFMITIASRNQSDVVVIHTMIYDPVELFPLKFKVLWRTQRLTVILWNSQVKVCLIVLRLWGIISEASLHLGIVMIQNGWRTQRWCQCHGSFPGMSNCKGRWMFLLSRFRSKVKGQFWYIFHIDTCILIDDSVW